MVRFGPAGNVELFFALNCEVPMGVPSWFRAMGLRAYEFSFGSGVKIREEIATYIKNILKKYDVAVSVHAPFYINLSRTDSIAMERTFLHILDSVKACDMLGGSRVVLHPGTSKGFEKDEVFKQAVINLKEYRKKLCDLSYGHIYLCPETTGNINQIGDLDEILYLCEADESFIPTLDFAHIHALGQGALNSPDDFSAVLRRGIEVLGKERFAKAHMHFSRVAYMQSGEKTHMSFKDTLYGPEYSHLIPLLVEHSLSPIIICESKGTQIEDTVEMLYLYNRLIT